MAYATAEPSCGAMRATRTSWPSERSSATPAKAARSSMPQASRAQWTVAASAASLAARASPGTAKTAPSPPKTKGRSPDPCPPVAAASALTCAQTTAAPIVLTTL